MYTFYTPLARPADSVASTACTLFTEPKDSPVLFTLFTEGVHTVYPGPAVFPVQVPRHSQRRHLENTETWQRSKVFGWLRREGGSWCTLHIPYIFQHRRTSSVPTEKFHYRYVCEHTKENMPLQIYKYSTWFIQGIFSRWGRLIYLTPSKMGYFWWEECTVWSKR